MAPRNSELDRRQFLKAGVLASAGLAGAGLLAACSSGARPSGAVSDSKTIRFANYPSWIGAHEIALFQEANPGVTVRQVSSGVSGSGSIIAQIAQDPAAYDMALLPGPVGGALKAGDLLQPIDVAQIPALAGVPKNFTDAYPWGIPTDYGMLGIAYRKDLVSEPIRGWKDLIALAPKYSNRIVLSDYDDDVMGAALIASGFRVNDPDPGHLQQALEVLLALKPHILAVLDTDITKPLVGRNATACISIDHDFSVAVSQQSDSNIVFVAPEEGIPAYIEGWGIIKGKRNTALIEKFMDFHLQPKNYADFLTNTGARSLLSAANQYLSRSVTDVQALNLPADVSSRFQYSTYVDPSYLSTLNNYFTKFKNA
jgi:spermidine/putrescine transport system substrate-binding protein